MTRVQAVRRAAYMLVVERINICEHKRWFLLNIGVQLRFSVLTAGSQWSCSCNMVWKPFAIRRSGSIYTTFNTNTIALSAQKINKIYMQNPPFCSILGLQNIKLTVICIHNFLKNDYSFSLWWIIMHWRLAEKQISKHTHISVSTTVVNIQHTFLMQWYKTHNKYSLKSFGSRNVAKNHLDTTVAVDKAAKRYTEQLLKLAKTSWLQKLQSTSM